MKKYILIYIVLVLTGPLLLAQPELESLQRNWVEKIENGEPAHEFYWENKYLIFADINSNDSKSIVQLVKSEKFPSILTYEHEQTFRHNNHCYITAGKLIAEENSLILLTGWRNVENNWKKEIDVILTQLSLDQEVSSVIIADLDNERKQWVKMANEHNPEAHINVSYTEDATYFGNGQKSQGRAEIADRYFYMENPNYQVDLVKEQLWNISENNVLEIGRYFVGAERSGTGGLYIILWQKQESGSWKIDLDFNF